MATMTFSDKVALARRALEWFRDHRKELESLGLNVDYWIRKIEGSTEDAVRADMVQEELKARLKAATEDLRRLEDVMYRFASDGIDAMIGAYGRNTPNAVQVGRMRSRLHRPRREKESTKGDQT